MGDVINLRQARKARDRREKEAASGENRAKFGRAKAEKALEAASRARAERELDGHRLDADRD